MQREAGQRRCAQRRQAAEGPGVGALEGGGGDAGDARQRAAVGCRRLHRVERLLAAELLGGVDQAVADPLRGQVLALFDQLLLEDVAGGIGRSALGRADGCIGRQGSRLDARGQRGQVVEGAGDLDRIVIGLHARAAFFGQALGPQHQPQGFVRRGFGLRELQRVQAEQPVVVLQLRGVGRREAGVAAADLEGRHQHILAGGRADVEGRASVTRRGQGLKQPLAIVAALAADTIDAFADGQRRVLRDGDDGQALVHLQRAHPGDPVVLAPAGAGGDREGQLPLLIAVFVLQGGAARDGGADQPLAGAIGAHAGQQGLVDPAAVIDGELRAGRAAAEPERGEQQKNQAHEIEPKCRPWTVGPAFSPILPAARDTSQHRAASVRRCGRHGCGPRPWRHTGPGRPRGTGRPGRSGCAVRHRRCRSWRSVAGSGRRVA